MVDERVIQESDIHNLTLAFDRKLFVEEILNLEFNGDIPSCAVAMEMPPKYLHELIFNANKKAGTITLSRILRYCKKTGKNPERYITKFIK